MGNDPDLTNICYANTTCPMFLFALEQYTGKSCFFKDLFVSICYFVLDINKQFLVFVTFVVGLNLELVFQHSKYEQKHKLSFVYKTKTCELCILLTCIIWLLTLNFWLIRNVIQSRDHTPLTYPMRYVACWLNVKH